MGKFHRAEGRSPGVRNPGNRHCHLLRPVSRPGTNRPSFVCAQDTHRGLFIQQLRPTQNLQPRIKLKLFGHSGSGKTTLVESLKCGLLRSFFRRRRPRLSSTNSTRFPPSPLASKPAGRRLPGALSLQQVLAFALSGVKVWDDWWLCHGRLGPGGPSPATSVAFRCGLGQLRAS